MPYRQLPSVTDDTSLSSSFDPSPTPFADAGDGPNEKGVPFSCQNPADQDSIIFIGAIFLLFHTFFYRLWEGKS